MSTSAPEPLDESGTIQSEAVQYTSVGGWLIFLVIGLGVSPFFQAKALVTFFRLLARRGSLRLTTPGTAVYHPLWAPMILFEILVNGACIAAEITLLVLLLRRDRKFPRLMAGYYACVLVVMLVVFVAYSSMPRLSEATLHGARWNLFRTILQMLVWLPYLYRSKRVKGTFTRD